MDDATKSPNPDMPAGNESPFSDCTKVKARTSREWAEQQGAELYRLLAENVRDVVWILDQNLHHVYVSPSVKNLIGWTPEEVLDLSVKDVLTPDSYQKAMAIFQHELALELSGRRHGPDWSIQLELEIVRADGFTLWTEMNAGFIYDAHACPIGLLGITRDIDDRRRIEMALKESEERYRLLAENARDVIWMRDLDFKAIYLSPSVKRLRGYTSEEAMQQSFQDMLTPASFQYAMQVFDRERQDKEKNGLPAATWSVTIELEVVCKDGSTKVTENTINLLYNTAGEVIGLMGITRDIDLRRKAEMALRESEEKYRLLIENANEGITVAQDGTIRFANPKAAAIIGHSVEALSSQPFDRFIHADDRAMVMDYHRKRLRGEELPDAYIFRGISLDGITRWVEIRVVLIAWESRPATLNFMTDITGRKHAEEALQERQARLDSIFRVAPVGIGVVVERVLVDVNDRICEMTGYARSELIGQSSRMLYRSQHEFEAIVSYKIREFQTQGWGHLETHWQRKDGGIIDILLNYTPIDPGDSAAEVIFTSLDITEHKRADEELKRHRDRLEELVKERTQELLQANMRLHREIAVRKRSEERLRAGELEHKERRKALEEMNVALKILLRQHQEDKENLERNLVANINTSLLVYLDKLKSSGLRHDQRHLISEIERQLKKVGTSFIRDLTSEHLGLSPSEIKVATLIKEGRSSKEIAELLNVSLNAVLFHRNNLRTKLGLKDSKVNLMTYLQHYDQN